MTKHTLLSAVLALALLLAPAASADDFTVSPVNGSGGGGGGTGCVPSGGSSTNIVLYGSAGACSPATSANVTGGALSLGASGTLGSVVFGNATSGTLTVEPVTGALGTVTVLIPAVSDTLVTLTATQTLTNKTLTSPTLTTPALGTPSAAVLTSATGLPISTGVSGLGTGVATALADNVGSAGAPVTFNGALGTPSSGTGTNITAIPNVNVNATPLATGSSTGNTLTAPRGYFICTAACTVTPPVPAAGYEFCVTNDDNVSSAITLGAIGTSARYENTGRTAYGTAGTGTFVSSGAVGDKACLLGRDATHYLTVSFSGTWTAS